MEVMGEVIEVEGFIESTPENVDLVGRVDGRSFTLRMPWHEWSAALLMFQAMWAQRNGVQIRIEPAAPLWAVIDRYSIPEEEEKGDGKGAA